MDMKVTTLADKAMLARLSRRKMRTARRDEELEQQVRNDYNSPDLTVTKHLFKSPSHPVRQLIRNYDAIYQEHTRRTAPWIDRGPRILPAVQFEAYMQAMREVVNAVDRALPGIVATWDRQVRDDMLHRGARAKYEDYPLASEVSGLFSVDYTVMPLPDVRDFRVDVSDDMKERLEQAVKDAEAGMRREAVERMLEPIRAAVKKLRTPIGEEGSIFRNSLVENLRDGIEQARGLVIDDEELLAHIEQVAATIEGKDMSPDVLRTNTTARSEAAEKLAGLMANLGGLMG